MAYVNCECDVFISYRRSTAQDRARTLQLELERLGYLVFFDYDSIRDGEFDKKIFKAIENCKVFIAFYSEGSLDNCCYANDWVRIELEYALRLQKKIVPVCPSDVFFSWRFPRLPSALSKLPYYQISEISMGSLFKPSVGELIRTRFDGIKPSVAISRAEAIAVTSQKATYGGMEACWRAADQSPDADLLYRAKKEWQEAVRLYQRRAESGDVVAQWKLGHHYLSNGSMYVLLGPYFYPEALRWLRKAADGGHTEAQRHLGDMYHYGHGVAKNDLSAASWWRKAAEKGDYVARNSLAEFERTQSLSYKVIEGLKIILGLLVLAAIFSYLGWMLYVTYWGQ